ncbi:MAG: hypothetical protein HDT12_00670, partial [Helicobacter sp.]|nr:hypothetical protein [Helicobacter sp.]
ATLNINGAGGVDKFNIEASSFTKTLTIAGNLGTVPNYEEANNNYDTVRIDLSKTSGVNLDISRLLVSNPNDEGIQITASKGADNITLVAGANHDVIEFSTGGGAMGASEQYTVDLANLRLAQGQSFTIDGLTITNVMGITNAPSTVATTAGILDAADIATLLQLYLSTGNIEATASSKVTTVASGSAISKYVRIEGSLESLTTANGWLNASGNAKVAVVDGTTLVFTNTTKANVTDLNLTFDGNAKTNGFGSQTNKVQTFVAGAAAASAQTSGTITYVGLASGDVGTGATKVINLAFNGETFTLTLTGGSAANTAAFTAAKLAAILNSGNASGSADIGKATYELVNTTNSSAGLTFTGLTFGSASGKLTVAGFGSGDSFTVDGTTAAYTPATPAVQGQLTIDFGSEGLLAGQSYSFLGKTVLATKDLSGEEVAEAFAFGVEDNSGVDGALVLGKWSGGYTATGNTSASGTNGIFESKVLFDISGSSLILMEQKPGAASGLVGLEAIANKGNLTITGTGTLAVRTDKVTGTTTVQGEKAGEIAADSYVTFAGIGTGSAASGADAGTVSAIKANTSMLDTITNFDISNDKLALKDVDGKALSFGKADMGDINTPTDAIYVDTLGSTLTATTGAGIISFGVTAGSGAATGADAITLDQKLYVAVNNIDDDKAVGFEHGGDMYVIVGSGGSGAGTADLVIKLAGVTGVTDITSILA